MFVPPLMGHFVRLDAVEGADVATSAKAVAEAWDNDVDPYYEIDGPNTAAAGDETLARVFPFAMEELGTGFGSSITQTSSQALPNIGQPVAMPTVSMVTQELTLGSGTGYWDEDGQYWAWSAGKGYAETWDFLAADYQYVDTTPEIVEGLFGGLYLVGAGGGVAQPVAVTEWSHHTGMYIQVWKNGVLLATLSADGGGSGGFSVYYPGGPVEGEPGTTLWTVSGAAGEVSFTEGQTQANAFLSFTASLAHGDVIQFRGLIESSQGSYAARFPPGEGSAMAQAVFGEALNAFCYAYPLGAAPTPPTPPGAPTPDPTPSPSPAPPIIGPPAPGDIDDDGDIDDADAAAAANNPKILTVTTADDEVDNDTSYFDLSLREALALAADSNHPGEDTIVFAPWVHTIDLDAGQLTIASGNNVVIAGPGVDQLAIDGNGISRLFQINSGAAVKIRDVLLHDGFSSASSGLGGAVSNQGTLTLRNATIDDSSAYRGGGIYNAGLLTVKDSTIVDNTANTSTGSGGGIYNLGTLTLDGATVDHNLAYSGGGIYNSNTVTVLRSTLINNVAYYGGGGGVYTTGANLASITDSTIDHNMGYYGAGVRVDVGRMIMKNSTVSTNTGYYGGGVAITGPYTSYNEIKHSTIAMNAGPSGAGLYIQGSQSTVVDNTIIASNSGSQVSGTITSSNYNRIAATAGLLPLGNYGGPTRTHALDSTSPAIDAGNPSAVAGSGGVPLYDQRGIGFSRVINGDAVVGARIDIGAFEYVPGGGAQMAALSFGSQPTTTPTRSTLGKGDLNEISFLSIDQAFADRRLTRRVIHVDENDWDALLQVWPRGDLELPRAIPSSVTQSRDESSSSAGPNAAHRAGSKSSVKLLVEDELRGLARLLRNTESD